jgi:hypothetical protein
MATALFVLLLKPIYKIATNSHNPYFSHALHKKVPLAARYIRGTQMKGLAMSDSIDTQI